MIYKKYKNPELGFELQYPGGWIVDEDPGFPGTTFMSMHEQCDMKYNENVSCFVDPFTDNPRNLKKYLKTSMKLFTSLIEDLEIIEEIQNVELLGDLTYRFKFKGNLSNYNVIIIFYSILWKNKIYSINLTVGEPQFNEILSIFEKMIANFKIFPPEPLTQEIRMQWEKDQMLASIDFKQVEHNINALSLGTNIQIINDLIDVFAFASMMDNLMGFGTLNYLYPKFHKNLVKTGLLEELPKDIISSIMKFNKFAKEKKLI